MPKVIASAPNAGGRHQRGRRVGSSLAEINVIPLVDVMLVLLIIFMVTAPLLATGVQVDLPESKAAALEQEREPVAISIEASGAVFVDENPVPDSVLAERLRQIAAGLNQRGIPAACSMW